MVNSHAPLCEKKAFAAEDAFGVVPKEDCPHLTTDNISAPPLMGRREEEEEGALSLACAECGDDSESWFCLSCWASNCSRYKQGHSLSHFENVKHPIAVSYSDLSVWCYECESYIKGDVSEGLHQICEALYSQILRGRGHEGRNTHSSSSWLGT
mmetsp:Transcript_26935/g.69256  ORF Transcript_26935/g.69256 Transcript_26935/m.69256 type:complete len:154 (-) Transcript_26935:1514-1975(-)